MTVPAKTRPLPIPPRSAPTERPASARRAPRRRRPLWGEAWRWLVALLLFAMLAAAVVGVGLVAAIYRQARVDQAQPVDAIVVLGAAQYNGEPGPVLRARLDHALDLHQQGMAPTIVVTGGRLQGDPFTEADASAAYLIDRGLPPAAILRETVGRDSWESMRGAAMVLHDAGLRRVLLVSDGFHLFRVKLMARDLGLTPYGSAAPNSPIRPGGGVEFSYVLREAAGVAAHVAGMD